MPNFEFAKDRISQHIVKYGVDVRPALGPKSDQEKLMAYCQWLTNEFPEVFETFMHGPNKVVIQKKFLASNRQEIELPTFFLTQRGPVYNFPVKILIGDVEDFDLPNKDAIFRKAIKKFRKAFPTRDIFRVGVINELIFDCGAVNSVDIVADGLSKARWKNGIRNITVRLENPREGKNVNVEITPRLLQQIEVNGHGMHRPQDKGFGVAVKVDINNQDMTTQLEDSDIVSVLTFAQDYMDSEFYRFLNNEEDT